MIEFSRVHQGYVNTGKSDWVTRYDKLLHPLRHWLYLVKLLSQGQLRWRGGNVYWNRLDRIVLEDEILLFFASYNRIARVLFVGCDWSTKAYRRIFSEQEYWTIDPNANRAQHGSPNHVVDGLENLTRHFSENYFDLIVCHEVWGDELNTGGVVNQAIASCFHCLNAQGILLVGWHHRLQSSPGLLSHCETLERFTPYVFPALSTSQYVIDTPHSHTFNFYQKPSKAQSSAVNLSVEPELSGMIRRFP